MPRQTKNELIKCEYCGEMYAVSYKHCPFCNEDGTGRWDDPEDDYYNDELPVRGGRRLAGGRSSRPRGDGPSVGRIISWVLSLALIIAAAGILFSLAKSFLGFGNKDPKPSPSQPPVESLNPTPTYQVVPTEPAVIPTVEPSQPPAPGPDVPSVDLTAPTDFKLKKDDISFFTVGEKYQMPVTLTPADAHATISWTSSNSAVATVSEAGVITAVSPGTANITASIPGVGERKCIVRCQFSGTTPAATPAPADPSTSTSSGSPTLSREDFTLSSAGESWTLKVSGTTSPVTWASSDSSIATVNGNGTVTAVSKGTCNVTATVDGVTLKCIVRCTF